MDITIIIVAVGGIFFASFLIVIDFLYGRRRIRYRIYDAGCNTHKVTIPIHGRNFYVLTDNQYGELQRAKIIAERRVIELEKEAEETC